MSPDLYIVILKQAPFWLYKVFLFSILYPASCCTSERLVDLTGRCTLWSSMQTSAVDFFVFSKWLLVKFFLKMLWKTTVAVQAGMLKMMSFKADSLADTNHEEVDFSGISVLWGFLFGLGWISLFVFNILVIQVLSSPLSRFFNKCKSRLF